MDILDHKVLGREFKRGVQQGELVGLRLSIEKRFGPIPQLAEERLSSQSASNLEALFDCFLDAKSLEELLP